jgi:hypothetical protein
VSGGQDFAGQGNAANGGADALIFSQVQRIRLAEASQVRHRTNPSEWSTRQTTRSLGPVHGRRHGFIPVDEIADLTGEAFHVARA